MSDETRESLGAYLRRNREEKGITLEQIERVTKIGIGYLLDIEEERFQRLPAPIFTLGFVKQYAQCIGLSTEDVVARYRLAVQQEAGVSRDGPSTQERLLRSRAFWVLIVILCALVFLWLFLYPGGRKREERVRSIRFPKTTARELKKDQLREKLSIGSESAHSFSSGGGAEGEGAATLDPSQREGRNGFPGEAPVALTLQATRKTTLKVTVDDENPQEKILEAGEQFSYKGQNKIQLEIGSGNGIRIFYGGKVYENLGRKGEIVQITFPPPQS